MLVFGAIQRFFPDFFPSCFTEQRQNLLQLYETAEYSEFKINETFNQKITRLALAAVYFIAKVSRGLAVRISGLVIDDGSSSETNNDNAQLNGIQDNKLNGSSSGGPKGVASDKNNKKWQRKASK